MSFGQLILCGEQGIARQAEEEQEEEEEEEVLSSCIRLSISWFHVLSFSFLYLGEWQALRKSSERLEMMGVFSRTSPLHKAHWRLNSREAASKMCLEE